MNSSHLSEEKVESYPMGRLAEPETDRIEEHLLLCAECQAQVQQMDEFLKSMKAGANAMRNAPPSLLDRVRAFLSFHPGSVWAGASVMVTAAALLFVFLPQGNITPQLLSLSTVRGSESTVAHAKANTPINLQLDVTELAVSPVYTVELVNSAGEVLRNFTNEPNSTKLTVAVKDRLPSGQYWVRLYGNSLKTELLREYSLKVD